jgi:hypothetical protein
MFKPEQSSSYINIFGAKEITKDNNHRHITPSLSKFLQPAAKLWAIIPIDVRKILLSDVWCLKCRYEVTITNFYVAVKAGDLLLVGKCSECKSDVARMIETSQNQRRD